MFNASLVAATSLFSIFLIIAMVTAMLRALEKLGSDRKMVAPFRKVMRNGHLAFWTLVIVTYFISLFFWPTPAVPLIGAVLVPVAIRAGLRPLAAGFTVAIAGQGMALSSDYVIRVAPGLSATAANADPSVVADRAFVLSLIVGGIALAIGYAMEVKKMRRPSDEWLEDWEVAAERGSTDRRRRGDHRRGHRRSRRRERRQPVPVRVDRAASRAPGARACQCRLLVAGTSPRRCSRSPEARIVGHGMALRGTPAGEPVPAAAHTIVAVDKPFAAKFFAIFVPLTYLALIVYLVVASVSDSVPDLQGGDAAALVGGIAVLTMFGAAFRPEQVDVHGDLGRAHRRRPGVRLQGDGCGPADRRVLLPRAAASSPVRS